MITGLTLTLTHAERLEARLQRERARAASAYEHGNDSLFTLPLKMNP